MRKGFRENKKAPSRAIKVGDDVSCTDDGKLNKKMNSGKRGMISKTRDQWINADDDRYKVDGNRGSKLVNSDWKRKRIYAGQDTGEGKTRYNNVKTPSRKTSSEMGWNKLEDHFVKEKRSTKSASYVSEQSTRKNSSRGGKTYNEDQSLDKKVGKSFKAKASATDKIKKVELDGIGNDTLKKGTKSKYDSRKHLNQSQMKQAVESLEKSPQKTVREKKSLVDDSQVRDDRPKKKKRVIRIDPHDITNKRMDDRIATNELTEKKKEDLEKDKNVEMSHNAQFRAIQPSPSILSFVEDNFLGRRREIELKRAGYNTELSAPLDNIPFSTSSEREHIEETVFKNKLTFFAAAKISSSFPPPDLPEIAFAGRSNVGKSSLLNSLTRQWGVVRTSDKPGLTQSINFFKLGPKMCLVDLPGYGFAYAKEEVKEAWEELVKEYVSTRVGLKRVCLLIDTKWGMRPRDHELIDLMERSQTKYQIVLTKTDLVFPIDVARRAMQIEESLKAKKSIVQPVMMASSKSGAGIRSLRTVLAKIARFTKL